ncbi:site-2 protease family protein [Candidatus Dojkabacteria bacterium]|uniref:Site-2 protease family protein n=1 Tax=Candidatus Dojkabacteria bacterium TaxID=2099670 RepID=A0A955RKY3_9BACT|nr:site-2 protease family protein [Candidatus Dojkabacteria bacterium]
MTLVLTIILLTLIFGLLVGIHEFGHFIAAKAQGIWVQEFAFGFGPKLFSKKIGETVYRLNLIPLGGYVKLHGEKHLSKSKSLEKKFDELPKKEKTRIRSLQEKFHLHTIRDDEKLQNTINGLKNVGEEDKDWLWILEMNSNKRVNDATRYSNLPEWRRLIIVTAGVIMNFILGVVIYGIYLVLVGGVVLLPKIVDYNFWGTESLEIQPALITATYDDQLEYLRGAIVTQVDSQYLFGDVSLSETLNTSIDEPVELEYFKDGEFFSGSITLDRAGSYQTILDSELQGRVILSAISEGSPAEQSNLLPGDIVLAVNGEDILNSEMFLNILEKYKGETITLRILREYEGELLKSVALLSPENSEEPKLGASFIENGKFTTDAYLLQYKTPVVGGLSHSVNMLGYQVKAMIRIFSFAIETGDSSVISESVSGPIGVGAELKNLIELQNFYDIINITALISLTLALMNILPLPVVDGGYVFLLALEKIRGKKISEKTQHYYNVFGLVLILLLTVLVTLKDIIKVFL